jgi:hypothetical protein
MEKAFFSSNNISKLLCLLRANSFGYGLKPAEIVEMIKPRMIYVYNNFRLNRNVIDNVNILEKLNNAVVEHFKNKSNLPSPIMVRKNEKISQNEMQRFMSDRNSFDQSVGLKPVNRVSIAPEKKVSFLDQEMVIEQYKDPLDEFFQPL